MRACRTRGSAWGGAEKKAAAERRPRVWGDQAAFYPLPLAVRTWAPRGQPPVLRAARTHAHLAAMSGIAPDGRLFMQTQDRPSRGEDVVRFLRLLLRRIPGPLLVIWDGAALHQGQAVKDVLAHGAARRLHLEPLPSDAPERNPDEGSGTNSSASRWAPSAAPT